MFTFFWQQIPIFTMENDFFNTFLLSILTFIISTISVIVHTVGLFSFIVYFATPTNSFNYFLTYFSPYIYSKTGCELF